MILKNKTDLLDTLKLLIYKENPALLEKIDLDNDTIFLEPLLLAYFNSKKDNLFTPTMLTEIMQGYFAEQEPLLLKEAFNKEGIAYVPNVGYFDKKGNKIDDILKIKNTPFELIIYPLVHLKSIFRDNNENVINLNKIEISKTICYKHLNALTNAFNYIKISSETHFNKIQKYCKKIVVFKINPENTNSFATINAHGIAFFNVYQEDYDEVFFVDDIAHQTGHIIMTSILFERKNYFIIDEDINIGTITKVKSEYRSFYVFFHALYTYYTTLLCLDNCITNNFFNKEQKHEAVGRIGFYLRKCRIDLLNFLSIENEYKSIHNILTDEAIQIYETIKSKHIEIYNKYINSIKNYNYKNQPYNFTYSKFLQLNPLPDV